MQPGNVLWGLFGLWACASVASILSTGALHDYPAYLGQWKLVLEGADPWSSNNAYGPVHNLFAPLIRFNVLAPKLVMGCGLIISLGLLISRIYARRGFDHEAWLIFVLAGPANLLVLGMGFMYGSNDTAVAALILFALLSRAKRHFTAAGVLLGVAGALKFFPLLLVPFFMFDDDRLRFRVGAAACLCFATIMSVAYIYWGDGVVKPLVFASERGPKILSLVQALNSHPWLFGGRDFVDLLIRANTMIALGMLGAAIAVCWRVGMDWLSASAIGMLTLLTAYKVGHQQFYLSWAVLVASLPIIRAHTADRVGMVAIPLLLFLSCFQVVYMLEGLLDRTFPIVRSNVGFVIFPLAVATIWLSVRAFASERRSFPEFRW